jgi:hypothetical protein
MSDLSLVARGFSNNATLGRFGTIFTPMSPVALQSLTLYGFYKTN